MAAQPDDSNNPRPDDWRRLFPGSPTEGGRKNMRVIQIGGDRRRINSIEGALARAGFQHLDTTSEFQLAGDEGWGASQGE